PWADADRIALGRTAGGGIVATALSSPGATARRPITQAELPAWVAAREAEAERPIRWGWPSTAAWYPPLLAAGVRVSRCHDLRLSHASLRDAVPGAAELSRAAQWDAPDAEHDDRADTLFDLDAWPQRDDLREVLAELDRQDAALSAAADPARMRVLLAAESAGA